MPESAPEHTHPGIRIVIAAYLLLGLTLAWMMPWSHLDARWPEQLRARYSPPDEGAHFGYVEFLADQRAFPVFDDPDGLYEAHQPPLYYLSCLPAFLIGRALSPVVGLPQPNDLPLLLMRCWSVLIGAAGVYAVYLLGLLLFRGHRAAALLAAGLAALLPMHTVNLSGVTNDGLAELLVTLGFIWAVNIAREATLRDCVALGVLTGLSLMVKSNTVFLFIVAGAAMVIALRRREDQAAATAELLRGYAAFAGTTLLICGAWWVRNQLLYGDPLAHRVFIDLFIQDRATPEYFLQRGMSGTGYLLMIAWGTALSFWGVFGQANVYMPEWFYLCGWLLSAAIAIGLVRAAIGGRAPWAGNRGQWVVVLVGVALIVAFYLRFNMIFYQVQARYLFTGIGPLAALMAAGWLGLWGAGRGVGRDAAGSGGDMGMAPPAASVLWWVVLGLLAITALVLLRPGCPVLPLPFLSP